MSVKLELILPIVLKAIMCRVYFKILNMKAVIWIGITGSLDFVHCLYSEHNRNLICLSSD